MLAPIWEGPMADPFVFTVGRTKYAVGTAGPETWSHIPLLVQCGNGRWESLGNAVDLRDHEPRQKCWAPEISLSPDAKELWMLLSICPEEILYPMPVWLLSVQVDQFPRRRFRPIRKVLDHGTDPTLFVAPDDRRYLAYNTLRTDGLQGSRVVTQQVDDQLCPLGTPHTLLEPTDSACRTPYGFNVEGLSIVRLEDGRYLGVESTGQWDSTQPEDEGRYRTWAFFTDNPLASHAPEERIPILQGLGEFCGAGHASLSRSDTGLEISWHAFTQKGPRRAFHAPMTVDGMRISIG